MSGGIKAKRAGESYEADFDLSLRHYHRKGLATWAKNHPETKVLGAGKAIIVGQALPDRVVILKGGKACYIEIKSFAEAKNKRYHLLYKSHKKGRNQTNSTRLNQFEKLLDFIAYGALGFYAVAFHHDKLSDGGLWEGVDWRLYNPLSRVELPLHDTNFGVNMALQFNRERGREIPITEDRWPDWLALAQGE